MLCFQFAYVQMTQVNVYLDGYEISHNIQYVKFLNRLSMMNFKAEFS